MITEKDTIKCEAVFNDEKTHRFLWKRVWNKDKPLACVIMLNPCLSDNIVTDTTTSLVVNNIAMLGEFGGVSIVNLFSLLTPKLQMRCARDIDINDYGNDTHIKKAAVHKLGKELLPDTKPCWTLILDFSDSRTVRK